MPFFSKVFKSKDGPGTASKSKKQSQQPNTASVAPPKPRWADAWTRKDVEPEEIQELLRGCISELKARGNTAPVYTTDLEGLLILIRTTALDIPFLLLPFRPASDPSAARTFIRNFFKEENAMYGERLTQELLLTEPMVSF